MLDAIRFSVLVPAGGAADYLESMLRTVKEQRPWAESPASYELLLGVDGCKKTLVRASELRERYPRTRVLYSAESVGPYVMRNTLAREALAPYFVFFDADDLMLPGLAEWCAERESALNVARFLFMQRSLFTPHVRPVDFPSKMPARGVFGIRRESFERLGGFCAWPCSADTEFHLRANRMLGHPAISPEPVFVYCRRFASLTRSPALGARSLKRKKYQLRARELNHPGAPVQIAPRFARVEEVPR